MIKDFEELKSIIFLLNYYNLLINGKRFFDYKFIKNGISIDVLNLSDDISQMILDGLLKHDKKGNFTITDLGKKILSNFDYDFFLFNDILSEMTMINYNEKVNNFILIRKAKNQEEIEI